MSFGGWGGYKPAGFKTAGWVDKGGSEVDKDGNDISGNCLSCGEYDPELINGFCRDDDCKRKRQSLAIMEGRAIKVVSDLPYNTKIIYTNEGKKKI